MGAGNPNESLCIALRQSGIQPQSIISYWYSHCFCASGGGGRPPLSEQDPACWQGASSTTYTLTHTSVWPSAVPRARTRVLLGVLTSPLLPGQGVPVSRNVSIPDTVPPYDPVEGGCLQACLVSLQTPPDPTPVAEAGNI